MLAQDEKLQALTNELLQTGSGSYSDDAEEAITTPAAIESVSSPQPLLLTPISSSSEQGANIKLDIELDAASRHKPAALTAAAPLGPQRGHSLPR